MITALFKCGLGNQMFQVAAAYGLARKHRDRCAFNLEATYPLLQGNPPAKYKDTLFRHLPRLDGPPPDSIYHEKGFAYREIPCLARQDMGISGFFQSEKYFAHCVSEVIHLFAFDAGRTNEINDYLSKIRGVKVGVHVRRGDYRLNPHIHPMCSSGYYRTAMDLFEGDVSFIITSDDIPWCKNHLRGSRCHFPEFQDELDDMLVLASCDHNIIANSSFSWWAAFLNRNRGKRILAPKVWFGPGGPRDTQDLIPPAWMLL
jgi:hypothetical protein